MNRIYACLAVFVLSTSAHSQILSVPFDWNKPVLGSQRLPDVKLEESRTPGNITIIDRKRIVESGARTLQEVLGSELGVNVFDQIGNSFQQNVELRGFNNTPVASIAVIIDGAKVNERDFNQVNYHLIPLETIERVEIHPGPGTTFGNNALGGVIHITTRRPAQDAVSAEAGSALGSFDRKKSWGTLHGTTGAIGTLLSVSKENDHGHRQNSDADINNAFAKVVYKETTLTYTRSDDRLDQPGLLTGAEVKDERTQAISRVKMKNRMDFVNFNHRHSLPLGLSARVNAHHRRRREETPINLGRTSTSESIANMEQTGFTAQISRSGWSAGYENTQGKADTQSNGSFGTSPFSSGNIAQVNSFGVYLQNRLDIREDRLTLTTGLRHDQTRVDYEDIVKPTKNGRQEFRRTTKRLGLNFNPSDTLRTYAVYSEGFRTPTVNEVSALGPFGQAPLQAVKARNYELGGKMKLGDAAELRASVFRTDVRDEIYFDPTQGSFGRNINVDKTRRQGIEWGLKVKSGDIDGYFNHTLTKATFEHNFNLSGTPWPAQQNIGPGHQLPTVPRHIFAAGMNYRPVEPVTLSWNGNCRGSQYAVGDEANAQDRMGSYCLLGLGAAYDQKTWRVFINAHNVLNAKYASRGIISAQVGKATRFTVPGEGASVLGGVSYRFSTGKTVDPAYAKK